jgi:hypothetical protein
MNCPECGQGIKVVKGKLLCSVDCKENGKIITESEATQLQKMYGPHHYMKDDIKRK